MVCSDEQLQADYRPCENDGLRILISFTHLNPYFKPGSQALSNWSRNLHFAQLPFVFGPRRAHTGAR